MTRCSFSPHWHSPSPRSEFQKMPRDIKIIRNSLKRHSKFINKSSSYHRNVVRNCDKREMKNVLKDAQWNSLSNDGIPVSNGLHFDELQINIISEDRSHFYGQNGVEIIKIRQNLSRFRSVQSFKIQESSHHQKRCARKFSEWWYPRLKQTSFW